ncbi:MAG: cytochrome c [bacterium]|nr:cytochrome c [bacterium]
MKRIPIVLACIAVVCVALTFETAAEEVKVKEVPITWQQASLGDGEALYMEVCAACHGAEAKGNGPAAPALAVPAPDLTTLAMHNDGTYPAKEVEKSITGESKVVAHGSLEMPVWGKVFEDLRPDRKPVARYGFAKRRIYDLTAYIETLQVSETE